MKSYTEVLKSRLLLGTPISEILQILMSFPSLLTARLLLRPHDFPIYLASRILLWTRDIPEHLTARILPRPHEFSAHLPSKILLSSQDFPAYDTTRILLRPHDFPSHFTSKVLPTCQGNLSKEIAYFKRKNVIPACSSARSVMSLYLGLFAKD